MDKTPRQDAIRVTPVAEMFIQVALDTPLNQVFDYLPPPGSVTARAGQRIRVPFGRREQTGIVVGISTTTEVPASKLRAAIAVLDDEPLLDSALLEMLNWAARYYQHPPGEVMATALPAGLRHGAPATLTETSEWAITADGAEQDANALQKKAAVQARFLRALQAGALDENAARELHGSWKKILATLVSKAWVTVHTSSAVLTAPAGAPAPAPTLTAGQQSAVAAIPTSGFHPCLLEGVTGSGKTEVYLHLIEPQIAAGKQALVLVPEIGLTPQLLERFRTRLRARIVVMHSGLTDQQRLENWVQAREGHADVIIGTRSAIFMPLARPGLIVVDEEHDGSFKQQDGFRYSARDLSVWRARQLDIPVVLGSATPALETLSNALEQRYLHLQLGERPGNAQQPTVKLIDLRHHPLTDGLSQPFVAAMEQHLQSGGQALIYLNRRGFAPTLLCTGCGTTVDCKRCDARMVLHQRRNRLICHHCGSERPAVTACPECGQDLVTLGQGTERLEQALTQRFPAYPMVRIDRDTTRKRGEMERMLDSVRAGEARILLGTQMLTKGHDFPDVSMVGIVDSDQGLFGTDFRSSERLAQSILQVAGRAGRGERPGEVWIQTWYPEHPLLTLLLRDGYSAFAAQALNERRAASWPPYSHIALLRGECAQRDALYRFLEQARASAGPFMNTGIRLLGPASSPMERRSGRYRGQLLVQSDQRAVLQRFLAGWRATLATLPDARRTRWSLDIDPAELF